MDSAICQNIPDCKARPRPEEEFAARRRTPLALRIAMG
jgi:hypothetical protein